MHILLFLYSNEYTGGLMTSVITVRIYVYGSSVALCSSSKRYSQTRGGTLWSMQWDFCPLLMHNSSNTIWPRRSFPAAALSRWILHQLDVLDPTALHLRSTERSEQTPGTLQCPWQLWAPQQQHRQLKAELSSSCDLPVTHHRPLLDTYTKRAAKRWGGHE